MSNPGPAKSVSKITPPKGTRDLYPEDALKRRYLEQSWRDASIRCGFEEIHGPTFETTDLYAVKSGEGILGELFQAYSGKAPEEVAQVQATGRAPYAMRPEFTPTLARMFAAKAGSLPKPCKWFTGGPYFRAERPQRGRLREFLQWNVDVIGLPGDLGVGNAEDAEGSAKVAKAKAQMDAECIECCTSALSVLGVDSASCKFRLNDRDFVSKNLRLRGVKQEDVLSALTLLDRLGKISDQEAENASEKLGFSLKNFFERSASLAQIVSALGQATLNVPNRTPEDVMDLEDLKCLVRALRSLELLDWITIDISIVRGLAYYTGTVFEVLADGERAIAGGGRYDNLIQLMGGPSTPAVGFAMGDVVVSLLLEDKGLMPQGPELMDAVSRRPASVRPEVFVLSGAGADTPEDEAAALDASVRRLTADLRRGRESDAYQQADQRKPWSPARYDAACGGVRPLHARVSYKSTRNLKKLLADAEKQHARLAAIVHAEGRVQLKDLDTRRDLTPKDLALSDTHAEFSTDPTSPVSLARAAQRILA